MFNHPAPSANGHGQGGYKGKNYDPNYARHRPQPLPAMPQSNGNGYPREVPRENKRIGGKYIQPVDRDPLATAPPQATPMRESYRQPPSPGQQQPLRSAPVGPPHPFSAPPHSPPSSARLVHLTRLSQASETQSTRPSPSLSPYPYRRDYTAGEPKAYEPASRPQPLQEQQGPGTNSSGATPSPITPGAPILDSLESIRRFRAQVQASRSAHGSSEVDQTRLQSLAESFLNAQQTAQASQESVRTSQQPLQAPQNGIGEDREPGEISEPASATSATTPQDEPKTREMLLKEKLLAAKNQLQKPKRDRPDAIPDDQSAVKRLRNENGPGTPTSAQSVIPTGPRNPDVARPSSSNLLAPDTHGATGQSAGISLLPKRPDPFREERAKEWNKAVSTVRPRDQSAPTEKLQPSDKNFVTFQYRNNQQRESRSPKREPSDTGRRDSTGARSLLERLSPLRQTSPPRQPSNPALESYRASRHLSPPRRGPLLERPSPTPPDPRAYGRSRSPLATDPPRRTYSPTPSVRPAPTPAQSYRRAPSRSPPNRRTTSPTPASRRGPSPAPSYRRPPSPERYRRPPSPHAHPLHDRPSSSLSYGSAAAPPPHATPHAHSNQEAGRRYEASSTPYRWDLQSAAHSAAAQYPSDPRASSFTDPYSRDGSHRHYEMHSQAYSPAPPAAIPAVVQTLAALKAQIAQLEAQVVSASAAALIPPPPPPPPPGQYYAFPPPPPGNAPAHEYPPPRPPSPPRGYERPARRPTPPPARPEGGYRRPPDDYDRQHSPPPKSFSGRHARGRGGYHPHAQGHEHGHGHGHEYEHGRGYPGANGGHPGGQAHEHLYDPRASGRRGSSAGFEARSVGYEARSGQEGRPGYDGRSGQDGRPGYEARSGQDGRPGYGRPGYEARSGQDGRPGYGRPGYEARSGQDGRSHEGRGGRGGRGGGGWGGRGGAGGRGGRGRGGYDRR